VEIRGNSWAKNKKNKTDSWASFYFSKFLAIHAIFLFWPHFDLIFLSMISKLYFVDSF